MRCMRTRGHLLRIDSAAMGHKRWCSMTEAHHLFSPAEKGLKEWLKFLLHQDYDFRYMVNVTGTAYIGDKAIFPDVVFRYGLKQAISDKVVKKPNYALEETRYAHGWDQTYNVHQRNHGTYGKTLKPITIVVTQEIATCVEVWNKLVEFLVAKEKISREEAEKKVIWVTSGIPTGVRDKERVEAAYGPRGDKDSPEKRRNEHLALLREVDDPACPVEWIVSVSMLTEGWDVKNVFQIVPHETRAFLSKLLIAQVLGRGLRVPPGLSQDPLVTINNHEAWSDEIGNLLKEVLEIENTLSWGYDQRHKDYLFPLYNLSYETVQKTVETKREKARDPEVAFLPQDRKTTEYSTFSETGMLAVEIEHRDFLEIDDAVKLMRLFLREKDEKIATNWPKKKLREFIVGHLRSAGQDATFLSKPNFLLLQQSFGPKFREVDQAHPRMSEAAKDLVPINLTALPRQTYSEDTLKEHGSVWYAAEAQAPYGGIEANLWEQYQRYRKQVAEFGEEASEQAKAIGPRLQQVDIASFKTPWNVHYASHEPERQFSQLLFANAELFDAFVKMPNQGGYSFPYSYKPSKAARTHTANENFNPDLFLRVRSTHDILVIEVKAEGDDSNRNRAKCRDGLRHFEVLNEKLAKMNEPWRYHFYFLSPEDYTHFFEKVRNGKYAGWKSGLMQELA